MNARIDLDALARDVSRRSFLFRSAYGLGGMALAGLMGPDAGAGADAPARAFMKSGSILKGRPSMGSWLLYGLGAETEELPGFVVLVSQGKGGGAQPVSARQWSSGFLPGKFQGVQFQSRGDAVHYVGSPE